MTGDGDGRRRSRRRLLLWGLLALGVLVAAQVSGLLDIVRDDDRLAQVVADAGWSGPVLFVVLMTVLVPLGVPGVPFVLAAGALWAAPVAVVASVIGGVTSSTIGIMASRRLGREALRSRIPRWLAGLDERLTHGGLWAVVLLRVVLYLIAPADWVIGLSHVPLRTALLGTALGLVPTTVGYVVAGPEFFRWLVTPAGLGISAVALTLAWVGWRIKSRRSTQLG